MVNVDPLLSAAAAYTSANWTNEEWRQFGRETGTSDILSDHPRLYRSLSFGDDDYPDAAEDALKRVLREGPEANSGEKGRMDLLAESMPDLPAWVAENGAPRTKRLFGQYLAARAITEIPFDWFSASDEASPSKESITSTPGPLTGAATEPAWPTPSSTPSIPPRQASTGPAEASGLTSSSLSAHERPTELPHIFIVHGHDEAARDSIRIYVHELTEVVPTSLAEKPGGGDTIIEKFERIGGSASYVIVLLTPDDIGQTSSAHSGGLDPNPRARQNVVLELGYFIGKIGRENIVVMDGGVERPSDLAGLSYVSYPGTNWKDDLRKELKHAGVIR